MQEVIDDAIQNKLTKLDLSDRGITIMPDLRSLNYITHVDLSGNLIRVADLSLLNTKVIKVIDLSDNLIEHVVLKTDAETVYLDKNRIADIESTNIDAKKVKCLTISNNLLRSLKWAKNMFSLDDLDASENNIYDFSDCPTYLKVLDLSGNLIEHVKILPHALKKLYISNNKIVSFIPSATYLEELDISMNALYELDIKMGSRLETLDVSHNRLTRFHIPPRVKKCNLSHNRLKNLTYMGNMEMDELNLTDNEIKEKPNIKVKKLTIDNNPCDNNPCDKVTMFGLNGSVNTTERTNTSVNFTTHPPSYADVIRNSQIVAVNTNTTRPDYKPMYSKFKYAKENPNYIPLDRSKIIDL